MAVFVLYAVLLSVHNGGWEALVRRCSLRQGSEYLIAGLVLLLMLLGGSFGVGLMLGPGETEVCE